MPTQPTQLTSTTRPAAAAKAILQSYAIGTLLLSSVLWSAPGVAGMTDALITQGRFAERTLFGSGSLHLLAIYAVNLALTAIGVLIFIKARPLLGRSPWMAALRFSLAFFVLTDLSRATYRQLDTPLPWGYVGIDLVNNLAWSIVTFQVAAHSLYRRSRLARETRPIKENSEEPT